MSRLKRSREAKKKEHDGEDPRRGSSRQWSAADINRENHERYWASPKYDIEPVTSAAPASKITQSEQCYYLRSTHCSWELIDDQLFGGNNLSFMLAYRFAKESLLPWPPEPVDWLIERQRDKHGKGR